MPTTKKQRSSSGTMEAVQEKASLLRSVQLAQHCGFTFPVSISAVNTGLHSHFTPTVKLAAERAQPSLQLLQRIVGSRMVVDMEVGRAFQYWAHVPLQPLRRLSLRLPPDVPAAFFQHSADQPPLQLQELQLICDADLTCFPAVLHRLRAKKLTISLGCAWPQQELHALVEAVQPEHLFLTGTSKQPLVFPAAASIKHLQCRFLCLQKPVQVHDGLETLELRFTAVTSGAPLTLQLPDSVTSIIIEGNDDIQEMLSPRLPGKLERLCLLDSMEIEPTVFESFPASLKVLRVPEQLLGPTVLLPAGLLVLHCFDDPSSECLKLLTNLQELYMFSTCDNTLDAADLSPHLHTLCCGKVTNAHLLPRSLCTLEAATLESDRLCLDLPTALTSLVVHCWNSDLSPLPPQLQTLTVGRAWDWDCTAAPLYNDRRFLGHLPAGLQELRVDDSVHEHHQQENWLPYQGQLGPLPTTLKKLHLRDQYCTELPPLPASLEVLHVGHQYGFTVDAPAGCQVVRLDQEWP